MIKVVKNERGAIILFTMLVSIIILLFAVLLLDGGIILHYRHQLQTVADAGSTAGINKASTYLTDDTNERVIDPEESVRNAFQLMYANLSGISLNTYKNDGTIASDGTEKPNYVVVEMTAVPLSDIEFETRVHGKVRSFFAPMLGMEPYTNVHVISRTKLISN